jgi:hypothetical protein
MNTTNLNQFDTKSDPWVGQILRVRDIYARVPDALLPRRVHIDAAWRKRAGTSWQQWFAQHRGGLVSFPDAPGDGTPSLSQLLDWLGRHGYRPVDDNPINPVYER